MLPLTRNRQSVPTNVTAAGRSRARASEGGGGAREVARRPRRASSSGRQPRGAFAATTLISPPRGAARVGVMSGGRLCVWRAGRARPLRRQGDEGGGRDGGLPHLHVVHGLAGRPGDLHAVRRDRGWLSISARCTHDGGHFSPIGAATPSARAASRARAGAAPSATTGRTPSRSACWVRRRPLVTSALGEIVISARGTREEE